MLGFSGKTQWVAMDCISGESSQVGPLPFEIGAGEGADFRLNGGGVGERHCSLNVVRGKGLCLIQQEPSLPVLVDGETIEVCPLQAEIDYAVKVGTHLLVIHGARKAEEWLRTIDLGSWTLQDTVSGVTDGPMALEELCKWAAEQQRHPQSLVRPAGLQKGFLLQDAIEAVTTRQAAAKAAGAATADEGAQTAAETLTCPVCWLKFDTGDIMHVATHDSLRGDPLLGEDAPQRFLATRFNDLGQALDALGLPCTEMACPHCRRVLPPGFAEMPHHILSIVGDQSAGKSYYLSVLLKMLPASLYQNFGVVFQDADPAGNAQINEMKQSLFSARTAEEVRVRKTDLEGSMYVRLPRYGRMVALPKPFIFSVAAGKEFERRCAIIFYDNAGEHFQPGRDSADSPGAQHVASSSGILFLFDPFNSPDFRHLMRDVDDPQLELPPVDNQGVILSEMKIRIAKLLNMDLADRIDQPLAVLIGKSDAWMHLLGEQSLRQPVHDGVLDLGAVEENSARVRELVKRVCPAIVANAESISRRVLFFPVSSFGHAPVRMGGGRYVPDPQRLAPFQVETPVLWALSLIEAGMVPSRE